MQNIFIRSGFLLLFLISVFNAGAQTANQRYLRQYGLLAGSNITAGNIAAVKGSAGANGTIHTNVQPEWAFYENNNGTVGPAINALSAFRDELNNLGPDRSIGTNHLDGQSLNPGVYKEGDIDLSSGSTFDLTGGPDDIYIFNLQNLQIGDHSVMNLGQVKPENIYWNIQDNFMLAENAEFYGVVLAANITLDGDYTGHLTLFATSNIALNGGNGTNTFYALQPGPDWEIAGKFALLANSDISVSTDWYLQGSAGTAASVNGALTVTDSLLTNNQGSVPHALSGLQDNIDLFNNLGADSGTAVLEEMGIDNQLPVILPEMSFPAGTYFFKDKLTLEANGPVTLTGDSSSVFIFNVSGSLSLDGGARIELDGIRPENVYWNVAGDIMIEDLTFAYGVFISGGTINKNGSSIGISALLGVGEIDLQGSSSEPGTDGLLLYSPQQMALIPVAKAAARCLSLTPAPNLVKNGGFEYMPLNSCPKNAGGISMDLPHASPTAACYWNSPRNSTGTPDYFNACASGIMDVPQNIHGWQQSHTQPGNAYIGLITWHPNSNIREYAQQTLAAPLKHGRDYYGEFYTSLGDRSAWTANRLGMYATTGRPALTGNNTLIPATLPTLVETGSGSANITENTDWVKIAGTFKAAGGENFLTIGNFNDNASTTFGQNPGGVQQLAYYYIDDVALYEIPYAGTSVTLCQGNSVTIGSGTLLPTALGATYQWSIGLSPVQHDISTFVLPVTPAQTTTYTLTVTIPASQGFAQSITTSSVTVTVPPALTVNPDFSVCGNSGAVTLTATPAGGTWSGTGIIAGTGSTPWQFDPGSIPASPQSGTVTYPLVYTYTHPGSNCTVSATVQATVHHQAQVTVSTTPATFCTGGSATAAFTNMQQGNTYTLDIAGSQGTSSTPIIAQGANFTYLLPVTLAGTYTLTLTDDQTGCASVTQFTIGGVQTLGTPGQLTTIDASLFPSTGTVTFSGDYRVVGPLRLIKGTFIMMPGTRFEVEPYEGVSIASLDITDFEYDEISCTKPQTVLMLDDYATLIMQGATITVSGCAQACSVANPRWGGINIKNNSAIYTYSAANPAGPGTLLSEVSFAKTGIGLGSRLNGSQLDNSNNYRISGTRFSNNHTGFWDAINVLPLTGGTLAEGIRTSFFEDCGTGIVLEALGSSNAGGDFSSGYFQLNNFTNCGTAVDVEGVNGLLLKNNTFAGNALAVTYYSVWVSNGPTKKSKVDFNTISVPAGGTGIKAHEHTETVFNTITGAGGAAANTGISFGKYATVTGNTVTGLENGLLVYLDNGGTQSIQTGGQTGPPATVQENIVNNNTIGLKISGRNYDQLLVKSNRFTNNATGIYSTETNNAALPPRIECNTFKAPGLSSSTGLHIGAPVDVISYLPVNNNSGDCTLGGDRSATFPRDPSGNLFENITNKIVYTGDGILTYYVYNNQSGPPSTDIPLSSVILNVNIKKSDIPGNQSGCGTTGDPGVLTRQANANPSAVNGTAAGLGYCYPNPAQKETLAPYRLPENCQSAAITIRDITTGRILQTYGLNPGQAEGEQKINLQKLRPGLYIYSLMVDGQLFESRLLSVAGK